METNQLYCGDNVELLRDTPSGYADLIYLDPPFFTQKDWGEFDDRFGDIETYVMWMKERLTEMHRILTPTGSIYLHCDWHASHYLKVEMDKMFGYNNFVNEIVWDYGARATIRKAGFPRKHDVILWYSKSSNYTFNPLYKPYKDANMSRYNKEDETGKYALIKRKRSDDTVYYGKCYANPHGAPETDVWNIPDMGSTASERTGYPTQKPMALLHRIIKASSHPGDTVLDPFCGCGTAIVAAHKLGRRWVGIDENPAAVALCRDRLSEISGKDTR